MPEFVVTAKLEWTVQAQDTSDADGKALNHFLGEFGVDYCEVLDIYEVPEGNEDPD